MYKFYKLMRFSTTGNIKFVVSNYFSIKANINTACERMLHQYVIKNYKKDSAI